MASLAINIRKLRKKYKITQDQLAERCEVSGAAVSQWESRVNKTTPEASKLLVVAKTLKTTVERLMEAEDIESEPEDNHELNLRISAKVFLVIDRVKSIKKSFFADSAVGQALTFNALYVIYKYKDSDGSLCDHDIEILMGLKETDPED